MIDKKNTRIIKMDKTLNGLSIVYVTSKVQPNFAQKCL